MRRRHLFTWMKHKRSKCKIHHRRQLGIDPRALSGEATTQEGVDVFFETAASPRILHQTGTVHQNGRWWTDYCDQRRQWTCFGPYLNLEPGHYVAEWYCRVQSRHAQHVVGIYVSAFAGHESVVNEALIDLDADDTPDPDGIFRDKDVTARAEFTLDAPFDKVEVLLRPYENTLLLHAKELRIFIPVT